MPKANAASSSQTATLTTEHQLGGAAYTADGIYALTVDTNNLAAGETLTLRAKIAATTGGTKRTVWEWIGVGPQTEKIVQSPPIDSPWDIEFTLTQTGGTGRAFPFTITQITDS